MIYCRPSFPKSTLQTRRKWQHPQPNLQVGDIVILHDENVYRGEWRLAKVVEVCTSEDGLVRSCKLRQGTSPKYTAAAAVGLGVSTSELVRPVHKVSVIVSAD